RTPGSIVRFRTTLRLEHPAHRELGVVAIVEHVELRLHAEITPARDRDAALRAKIETPARDHAHVATACGLESALERLAELVPILALHALRADEHDFGPFLRRRHLDQAAETLRFMRFAHASSIRERDRRHCRAG